MPALSAKRQKEARATRARIRHMNDVLKTAAKENPEGLDVLEDVIKRYEAEIRAKDTSIAHLRATVSNVADCFKILVMRIPNGTALLPYKPRTTPSTVN